MKQVNAFLARWNWWMVAYNVLWFAAFCWFMWYGSQAATNPANKNAGMLVGLTHLAIAAAPVYGLWALKRLITGRWLS